MVEDPIQHRSCKHRVAHHLSPVNDLFVGGKDDGAGFIGIADKSKKTVCLAPADWRIANLIDNNEYSCEMKSHFRKSGNQMSGKWKSSYTSLLA